MTGLALVDRLRRLPRPMREELYRSLQAGALATRRYDWRGFLARPDQLAPPPEGDWGILLWKGGRGSGKTRALLEFMHEEIFSGRARAPRIIAATAADVESTIVDDAHVGIMAILPRDRRPQWQPSKGRAGRLIYPNRVVVECCAAAEPEQLVGMNTDLDIMDDPAKWPDSTRDEAWNHARASCRVGYARAAIATTFRKSHILRRLLKKGDFAGLVVRELATFDNAGNVAPRNLRGLADMDEAFRRREYEGLDDNLSSPFAALRFALPPIRITELRLEDLAEVVVAVDPAKGKGPGHDDWGIGALGRRHDRHLVALEDVTGSYDDGEGAAQALDLCERWGAQKIIVEANTGPHVESAIKAVFYQRRSEGRAAGSLPEIVRVTAREQKILRAGPLLPLYLGGSLHHLPGLEPLEHQMAEWDPEAPPRPKQDDHIDWLVHAVHAMTASSGWALPTIPSAAGGLPLSWMKERSPGHSTWLRGR